MSIKKFENFKPDTQYCDGGGDKYHYFADLKAFGFY